MRDAAERRLHEDRRDARGIERGGDDVRGQPVVQVAAVAQLDLLDRGVADRLERAALDLALGEHGMDDPADVVGGHDIAHVDLAGIEVDVDAGDAGRPAERRVRVAAVGLVVEADAGIRLEALVDPDRASGPGVGAVGLGEGPPVAASTSARRRRARLDEHPADDHRGPRGDGRPAVGHGWPCPAARSRRRRSGRRAPPRPAAGRSSWSPAPSRSRRSGCGSRRPR